MDYIDKAGRIWTDADTDQPGSPLWVRSRGDDVLVGLGALDQTRRAAQDRAADLTARGHAPPAEWVLPQGWPAERARLGLDAAPERAEILRLHLVHGVPIGAAIARVKPGLTARQTKSVHRACRRALVAGGWD